MKKLYNNNYDSNQLVSLLTNTPSWLIGSILGDTHVNYHGRLDIGHSIKQKEYFLIKYNKLKEISALSPKKALNYVNYKKLDKRTNQVYEKVSITTLSHFLYLRNYFYKNNIKFIPSDLPNYFNEEALAFWYMDDGGRNSKYGKGMVLDITCFTLNDQFILKNMMEIKFNCQVTFHKRNYKNSTLYIKSCSALHFCNLIRPYIIPSMLYKLTC